MFIHAQTKHQAPEMKRTPMKHEIPRCASPTKDGPVDSGSPLGRGDSVISFVVFAGFILDGGAPRCEKTVVCLVKL